MYCLKCGKETTDNQVFCERCLGVMSQYPVKPDTIITLPQRPVDTDSRKQPPRKRALQPEEQIAAMHRLIKRLIVALIAVSVLFALTAAGLAYTYKNNQPEPTVGRNYTINTGRRPGRTG